ncbi:MAG: endonuclease/exonuclease/phosphatase family protein [Leptospiraceae bacterium]|nr:endonuclease/exonuclease/phosphatase family protein [Leptospiraceae bacterium]
MKFSVATWNCFGMGQSIIDVITHLRAPFGRRFGSQEVIEECGDSNVLCIQEILSRESQRFFDGLVQKFFPFAVRDNNKFGFISLRGSGLGVGTRAKQRQSRFMAFRTRGISWDKYARKGALYVQLEYGDRLFDIMTVHLQAGKDLGARAVRAAQLVELKEWVSTLGSKERPFIVCGDFNIQGLASERKGGEYEVLTSALDGFSDLGADTDLATYHPHPEGNPLAHAFEKQSGPMRIDYIFLRPAEKSAALEVSGFRRIFDKPLGDFGLGLAAWASDHYGLKATFEI